MLPLPRFRCVLALLPLLSSAPAQIQDGPAVDPKLMLKELQRIHEQQTSHQKQLRQAALQQINAAAASPERAVVMYEDAVRAVQFDGVAKEHAAFKEWKEREGDGLQGAAARSAAHLFFAWLSLTIQRDADMPVKDLLPQVVNYTKELISDQAAADALDEEVRREKDAGTVNKRVITHKATEAQVKKMHDQILRKTLSSNPVVQWLKITDFVAPDKWETNPSNLDGIYKRIILPEFRAAKDPRVLDYWDLLLKKEAETASKTKLAFEIDKFNNDRRPSLLWSRAEDMILIGQKNRGIAEMFNIIKTYPQHSDGSTWIEALQALLLPPVPVAPALDPAGLPASAGSPSPAPVRAPGTLR